jgi:hypothetical protein
MKTLKFLSLMFIAFVFIMGCAGNYGKFKRQSESESKVTKRELIDNWSDYDIWLHYHPRYKPPRLTIIVFDTKNDDKKVLSRSSWPKVKDQEMWTEIVKANTASDGEFTLVWQNYGHDYSTGVHEIWGFDNQLYGYIIYQQYAVSLQRVEQIDENTIQISWSPPRAVGGR